MTSHYTAVGLPLREARDLEVFLQVAARFAQWVRTKNGYLIYWGPDEGVEFWGQADRQRQLVAGNAHYVGSGRISMAVERCEPQLPSLDGLIVGQVNPHPDGTGFDYPLAVELPDFDGCLDVLSLEGLIVALQVAAFVEQGACYRDAEDFHARAGELGKLASEALIPTGLFLPGGEPRSPVEPRALMTGNIQDVQRRTNSFSRDEFWALAVRTFGGWYDVVADPDVLQGEPQVGGIFAGVCYLSGQIAPNERLRGNRLPSVARPGFVGNEVERISAGRTVRVGFTPPGRRYHVTAAVGLLLALIGILCIPAGPAAAVCCSYVLWKMSRSGNWAGRWLAIIGLVLGTLETVTIVGALAAIAATAFR